MGHKQALTSYHINSRWGAWPQNY